MARHNVPRFLLYQGLVNCFMWMPVWILFLQGRGMSLGQIGVFDAIGWVIMALSEVPTGAVADRWGRKTSLALGALLYGLAMFALTARLLSPIFIVGVLLWNTSMTLWSGADSALLYDTLAADGRAGDFARLSGRSQAVLQVAQGLGAALGGVAASINPVLCFLIPGCLALAAALVALTMQEPPPHGEGEAGPRAGYWQTLAEALRIARRGPVCAILLFGAVISVVSMFLGFYLLQPFAAAVGFPVAGLGILSLLTRGASIAGAWLAGRASNLPANALLWGWVGVLALAHLLLAAIPAWPVVAVFALTALASGAARPSLSALLNDRIPSAQRATILSLQGLLWTGLLALTEPVVLAVAQVSIAAAILLSGTLLGLAGVPLLLAVTRLGKGSNLQTVTSP
jgi:predicted MFS family arabinose efflux permease